MKLATILLAGSLSLSSCAYLSTEPQISYQRIEKKTLREDIGYDNVVLKKFENLDENITSNRLKLPEDLEKLILERELKSKHKFTFENQVYKEALKLGFTQEQIKDLTPKQTIQLTADIVKQKLSYSMKYNYDEEKSLDELFDEGIAECSMYSHITTAVFNIFKRTNPKLKNFYIIDAPLNTIERLQHNWNTILVYNGKTLQIPYIDTTFYEHEPKIDATDDYHIDPAWKEILMLKLKDYNKAMESFQKLLKSNTDRKTQADILIYLRSCAVLIGNKDLEEKYKKELIDNYQDTLIGKIIKTQELIKR